MFRILITTLLIVLSVSAFAQEDSLHVFPVGGRWMIIHTVHSGETIFSLARRYHVPPAMLTDANGLTYQSAISSNTTINIPVGAYNLLKDKPANMNDARPLYYRVTEESDLYKISKYSGVSESTMQNWNYMADNTVHEGQVLFVGWVLYDATNITAGSTMQTSQQGNKQVVVMGYSAQPVEQKTETKAPGVTVTTIVLPQKDTSKLVLSPEEQLYMKQTDSEKNVMTEKGPAAFFETRATSKVYYAFHNTARRGTIMKVYSPGTEKTIYVKVIGPIPNTKQYYNSIIGISSNAKEALGVTENKDWCELTYAK